MVFVLFSGESIRLPSSLTSLISPATVLPDDSAWSHQGVGLYIPLIAFFSAATELYLALVLIAFALRREKTVKDAR